MEQLEQWLEGMFGRIILRMVLDLSEATGNGSGWSGSTGLVDKFSVVSNNWAHYNNQHLHDWNVWYDGSGAFYLQYSAVPEPSTYMMVTGLLMVPGMSYHSQN